MTALHISDSCIPRLENKVCMVTGGSSGIGFATVQLLASRGAEVHILDVNPPEGTLTGDITFHACDQTSWMELNAVFAKIGSVDIAIANAGVSEADDFGQDTWESEHSLREPDFRVIDVNLRGTVYFVKLASAWMRRQGRERGGSIVITSSATGYAPEQSLPVYSGTKHALIGFMRAQRSVLPMDNITINCVAPAATVTALLPVELATPLIAAGLPVSTPEHVARAIVFSATATQDQSVEEYGKDLPGSGRGRWNGRTIFTLDDTYTELEGGLSRTKTDWFGENNLHLTRLQQTATDFRPIQDKK